MNKINELHQIAMDLAELSHLERLQENFEKAKEYLYQAFLKEKEAALSANNIYEFEPTKSVLLRSAASLAIKCGENREAEKLITLALSAEPAEEIAAELRDLLEEVYFNRHLETKGISLNDDELQLSLAGNAVSFGVIQSGYFLGRIQSTSRLIYRTVERLLGKQYRDDGKVDKAIRDKFDTFISVPRPASFAVTIKIGHPSNQIELFDVKPKIVKEIMNCFGYFEKDDLNTLKKHIKDDAYYTNFVSLSKQLLPDGENISFVGFTANVDNKKRDIKLTKTKKSFVEEISPKIETDKAEVDVTISGMLLYADSTKNKREIRLVDEENKTYKIHVPKGMMDDIVKPLWDEEVIVKGTYKSKTIIQLKDIDKK